MNRNISLIAAACLLVNLGCGGGSSSTTTPPPPPPPPTNFSFKVFNEDDCGVQTPLSGVEFLIYDESPSTNPETTYTTVTSNANGIVELDIPVGQLMSFTINHTDDDGYIKSYSFIDLASNEYNMALTYDQNTTCECEFINVDAQVDGSQYISEIRNASLLGGTNIRGGYHSVNGNLITFTDVELCNDDFSNQPVISSAELYNYDDRIIYGLINNPTSTAETIILDKAELKVNKPDLGENYSLSHALVYNDQTYLLDPGSGTNEETYAQYAQETPDSHQYSFYAYITGTYNGVEDGQNGDFVGVSKRRFMRQTSSDAASAGSFPTGTFLNVNHNSDEGIVSWSSDTSNSFSIALFYRNYQTPDNKSVRSYLYAPSSESVVVPKNKPEIEAKISESRLQVTYLSLLSTDSSVTFSQHLNARRFADANGNSNFINENSLFSYLIPFPNPTNSALKSTDIQSILNDDVNLRR